MFIDYDIGVKGYKIYDLISRIVFHIRNVPFREVKPSPIMVQVEDDEKSMLYLLLKTQKEKIENTHSPNIHLSI
jgi:hypothetical protein